jgi:acyl-CoA synthetase (AMP-forming)/AMP-acid ligase II
VQEIFVFGAADGAKPAAELMAAGGRAPEVSIDPARDLVTLPYSSGTTGVAKGVMLTHRNVVANVAQVESLLRTEPADVSLAVAPFFHALGLAVILAGSLHAGATVITQPRFELDAFLAAIQKYRVTWLALVPPIMIALGWQPVGSSNEPCSTDLSRTFILSTDRKTII